MTSKLTKKTLQLMGTQHTITHSKLWPNYCKLLSFLKNVNKGRKRWRSNFNLIVRVKSLRFHGLRRKEKRRSVLLNLTQPSLSGDQ